MSRRASKALHLEKVRNKHWHRGTERWWQQLLSEALGTDSDWLLEYSEKQFKYSYKSVRQEAAGKSFRYRDRDWTDEERWTRERDAALDFRNQVKELESGVVTQYDLLEDYGFEHDDPYYEDPFEGFSGDYIETPYLDVITKALDRALESGFPVPERMNDGYIYDMEPPEDEPDLFY